MKTVSKKLLSLMLVAILLVSALPFQAFAAELEGISGDLGDIYYRLQYIFLIL